MRAETQNIVSDIENSLELLRQRMDWETALYVREGSLASRSFLTKFLLLFKATVINLTHFTRISCIFLPRKPSIPAER